MKNLTFAVCFLVISAASGIAAYYRVLTGFAAWDDEGAMMVTVKQYLAGVILYNQIPGPYGPVYYFYNWAMRTVTGTPETHDVVRMSTLLPWLLTAFVAAWIVFRLTSSMALAAAAHLAVFFLLRNCFDNEPGHPQELCILLLVSLVGAGVVASTPKGHLVGIILIGVLTAALLLVKVNIGVFAILAVSLAVLAHSPKTKLSQLAFYASAAASLLLPAVLMKAHLSDWPTQMYAVLVSVSMMAALLVLARAPRVRYLTSLDLAAVIGAFVSFFLVVVVILKIQGVFLNRALHALLLDALGPRVFHSNWYIPLPFMVERNWYLWMMAGLFLAGYLSGNLSERRRENGITALKFLLILLTVVDLIYKVHPLGTYSFGLVPDFFFLVPSVCWLLLFWNSEDDRSSYSFARTLFCVLAILQMLYTYPVAGSQVAFVEVLPILALLVCVSDVQAWRGERLGPPSAIVLRALGPVAVICVAVLYLAIARGERNAYNARPSLELPGAGRIHLIDEQAQDYRWLVSQINTHCDVFVGLPELPSLHIWTGKDPVGGAEMNDWMIVMTDEQQLAASTLLSQHPNACAVYNQQLVDFWDHPHHDLSSFPLVAYLLQNFKFAGRAGPFALLVHNDRDLSVGSIR